jgi:hypothetical protein
MVKKTWGAHNSPAARKLKQQPKDKLTDRERLLAHGIVGGLSRTAAYRKAGYATSILSKGDIETRPRFVRYLQQLRDRQVERLDYSIDNLCARLEFIAFSACDEKQYGAAVSAVMGIAKMMGHLADKTEIELHMISKPAREPTSELTLSPEEWQRQFAPKQIN